jgi:hypothetical protein
MDQVRRTVLAALAGLFVLASGNALAEQPGNTDAAAAAARIADIFGEVGDQIYEDCIFELSPEQIEVQQGLIAAYIEQGASSFIARRLAVDQIKPPQLSPDCERLRSQQAAVQPETQPEVATPPAPAPKAVKRPAKRPAVAAAPKQPQRAPQPPAPPISIANKKVLPQWDCAPNVDFVIVHLGGYPRKLTGGEICNPYQDVVHEVPASVPTFRFGYTIATGRLFVISDDATAGKTIAWAISGRDVCRNNPDPDCLAAKSVGSLPPGEYSFSGEKARRVTWGPRTKRNVAGIYLRKLWNKDRFSQAHIDGIMKRGNIAIHARLKGEMSEACIGLEPKGWAYVASLIKEGRATGVNVYLEEPYPQIAEAPPVVVASSFSLTSLFSLP